MIYLSRRKINYSFFAVFCIILNFLPSCTKPVVRSEKNETPAVMFPERPELSDAQKKEIKARLVEKYTYLIKEIQNARNEKDEMIELINMDTDKRKSDTENKKAAYAKNRIKDIDEIYIKQLKELKDTAKKLRFLNYSNGIRVFLEEYEEAQNELKISREKLDLVKNQIRSFLNEYWSEKADEKQAIAAANDAEGIRREYDALAKIIKITEKELEMAVKENKNTDYLKEYLSESKKLLEEYEEVKREAVISKKRLESVNLEKNITDVYPALIKMINITEKEIKDMDDPQGKAKLSGFKTAIEENENYYKRLQKEIETPKNKLDEIGREINIFTAKERVANIRGNYKEVDEYKRLAEKARNKARIIQIEYDALMIKINKIEKELRNTDYLKEYLSEARILLDKYEKAKHEDDIAADKLSKINGQTNIYLKDKASMVKSWSEITGKIDVKGLADEKDLGNIRKRYYASAKELEILEKELGAMGYSGEKFSRRDQIMLKEVYKDIRKEVKTVKNKMDGINWRIKSYYAGQGAGGIQPDTEKDKLEIIKKTAKDLQEKYDNLSKELLKIKKEIGDSGLSQEFKNILVTGMTAEEEKIELLENYETIQDKIITFKNLMEELNEKINIFAAKERAVVIRRDQENAEEYKDEKEFYIGLRKCVQDEYDKLTEKIKPVEKQLEITERVARSIEKKLGYQEEKTARSEAETFLERYRMARKEIKNTREELDRTNRKIYVSFPELAENTGESPGKDEARIEEIKNTAKGLQERYEELSKEIWEIKKELDFPECSKIDENILEMDITADEKNELLLEIYEGLQSEMKASEEDRYRLDILQAEGMIYSDLQRTAKYGSYQGSAEEYKRRTKAVQDEKRRLQRKYDNLKKELEIIKKEF